jgi:hypothetical protein
MTEVDQNARRVIDDEIIKARVREMIGAPKPAAQSRFTRISSNPLAPLIVGFILTGIVGTSLTSYYMERQKRSDAARQQHENDLDARRKEDAQTLEGIRKRDLLEIQHKQHMNAQALEAQTAQAMKEADALRARRQKDLDYARSQMNVVEDRKLELAKVLEVFVKYVNSDDPTNRTFGYDMFVFFGHGEWAARLIAQKGDPAGRNTLKNIQSNTAESASVRQMALGGLAKIGDTQLKRILSVRRLINLSETGHEDVSVTASTLSDGLRQPRDLIPPFEAYLANSAAPDKNTVQSFMDRVRTDGGALKDDASFKTLIKRLETDPVMTTILEEQFTRRYLNPALQIADQLGVKTVLGLAVIFDVSVFNGASNAQKFTDQATAQLGGTPRSGVDEKQWVKTVLEVRLGRAEGKNPMIKKFIQKRNQIFFTQAARNNWDLLPPFEVKDTPESGGQ